MLYLPPNIAHHGVALDAGMTWSFGSRAPSGADLLQGLGEWLAFSGNQGGRYSDPGIEAENRAGEINQTALRELRKLMLDNIHEDEGINNYLGSFLSRFRLAHEPMPPPELINSGDLQKAFVAGKKLFRNPWTRLTWIDKEDGASLFAAGQIYDCSSELAELLCGSDQPLINISMLDDPTRDTVTQLVNTGHFLLLTAE